MSERTLFNHPLLENVLENLQPLLKCSIKKLKDYSKKTGKIRLQQNQALLEHQFYDLSVFHSLAAILNSLDTLKNARGFIANFPRPRTYEKIGISNDIWIEYHYSYYVVTFVSFLDLALILTNNVFRLGLREKDCKAEIIKNNSWIKNTNVKLALTKLEDIVKPFRELRNFHVHRGQVPRVDQIFDSELYDTLKLISRAKFSRTDFWDHGDTKILDLAYKQEMKLIVAKLQKDYENLIETIVFLFDELIKKYEEFSKLLHQLGK